MTLQWTVVAVVLYIEIAVIILLLLPWIRPHLWQKLFKSRLMKALETYSHVYAWCIVGALVLLFMDAIREMRKYGNADLAMESILHTANADAVIHMRLFRAQRNLYISGFALFLWLVIRRLVSLISSEAKLEASALAALKQAQNASDVARSMMDKEEGEESKEVKGYKVRIEELETALNKAETDRDAMQKQAEGLQKEYDRLAEEHIASEEKGNKKDD